MAERKVENGELHVGSWVYHAPAAFSDREGITAVAGVSGSLSDGEYRGLGTDKDGEPYEKQGREADAPKWKRIGLEKFIDGLEEYRAAIKGTALEERWSAVYDDAVKAASLAYARSRSALYGGSDPIAKRYTVYDLFKKGTEQRTITTDRGDIIRLEKYVFNKLKSGKYELEIQMGWHAGSHWDGGTSRTVIRPEWLALPWDGFLDAFCDNGQRGSFIYCKRELEAMDGLKEFFGFRE